MRAWEGPLYRLFEAEFAVQMIRAEEKIRAVAAAAEDAALLEVAVGAPLLSVERLSYTFDNRPMELRRGVAYDADLLAEIQRRLGTGVVDLQLA